MWEWGSIQSRFSRRTVRLVIGGVAVLLLAFVLLNNIGVAERALALGAERNADIRAQGDRPIAERDQIAPPRQTATVIATDTSRSLRERTQYGDLIAIAPNGTLLYHEADAQGYWDVDPVPNTSATVQYVTISIIDGEQAGCEPVQIGGHCTRNTIHETNITTGESRELFSRVVPRYHDAEWHDVDRINESHYTVADIRLDRVFIIDVEHDVIKWSWNAKDDLPLTGGGPYPDDWTHLNDVEVLDDGRIMVNLRNQDQTVFIDPETGLQPAWTLGEEDETEIMYEQHNPDYIPPANGGPAIPVADSENNRVIEYQRTNGSWNATWGWADDRMQWPRDADRLPNGNTLITDSHGERVLEVDPEGSVVWSFDVALPYEAERLGTGDESTGGPAASRASLQSRGVDLSGSGEVQDGGSGGVRETIKGLFPTRVVNGTISVLPNWVGLFDLIALLGAIGLLGVWAVLEARWSRYKLRLPIGRR